MAHHYRAQVEDLYTALQEDSEARRMEATDVLRSLVKEIVLTPDPENGELLIEVHGDLAGILTIALERRKPADGAGGVQVKMVAGTCSNQNLRTQKSRPDGAAGSCDGVSQFEMVAGAGSNLHLLPEQVKMVAGTGVDHNLQSTPAKMVAGARNHLYRRSPAPNVILLIKQLEPDGSALFRAAA